MEEISSYGVQGSSGTKDKKVYFKFAHLEWGQNYKILKQILENIAKKNLTELTILGISVNNIYSIGKRKGKPTNTSNFENFLKGLEIEKEKKIREEIIPFIADRALKAETEFGKNSLEILKNGGNGILTLSRFQASILLSLMFFGLIPKKQNSWYLPNNQDLSLIFYPSSKDNQIKLEKIKFLMNYFERISEIPEDDLKKMFLSVQRNRIKKSDYGLSFWRSNSKKLQKTDVKLIKSDEKRIEDSLKTVKIDFANEFLGGGVLSKGAVQEEILLLIYPENLIWCLLTERILLNESISMTGAERFSNYSGYSKNLKFEGNFEYGKKINFDGFMRKKIRIEAIDALNFKHKVRQYRIDKVIRELIKALVGFEKKK